jgi:hypothetical protein
LIDLVQSICVTSIFIKFRQSPLGCKDDVKRDLLANSSKIDDLMNSINVDTGNSDDIVNEMNVILSNIAEKYTKSELTKTVMCDYLFFYVF